MHDASKVRLGANASSAKDITHHPVDPASFRAGTAVSMASTGVPSALKSAGFRMGVALGPSLSDTKKLAVLRCGERVAMLASYKRSFGTITVTSFANLLTTTPDSVTIGASVFVAQSGAATPGTLFFRAATDNNATAVSLAAQINSHATASTLVYAVVTSSAVVTLYAVVDGAATGNDVAVSYTDNGGGNVGITLSNLTGGKLAGGLSTVAGIDYISVGAKAYINDATGKLDVAMTGLSTVSDAIYVSGALTGIDEDNAEVPAAQVDMTGGL